jgi:hypothetical protein
MAPVPIPHPTTSASDSGSLAVEGALAAITLLCLAVFILPGLMYALHAAVLCLCRSYGDSEEIFGCERNTRRPMSSDRIDEYVVFHRPDLLLIDAVASVDGV